MPRFGQDDSFPHMQGEGDLDSAMERGHPLTSREAEVIELVCEGKSNKEIARALYVTLDTAKAHVARIMHKLGARNRTEAALAWKEMRGPNAPTLDRDSEAS